jgi:hypothetical protein
MFYILLFAVLAVVLVIAGATVLSKRRTQLEAQERRDSATTRSASAKRKAQRAQSQHDRRKRH